MKRRGRRVNQSWNEKISIEYLKSLEFGKSFKQAVQISDDEYEQLDTLHYKVENELLKLIESLQKKKKDEAWEDAFQTK